MRSILGSLLTTLGLVASTVVASPASALTLTTDNGPLSNASATFIGPTPQAYGLLFEAPVTGTLDSVRMATFGGWAVLLPEIFGGMGSWTDGSGSTGTTSSLFHGAITQPMVQDPTGAQLFTFTPNTAVTAGSRYVVYLSTIRPVSFTGYASVPDTLPGYLGTVYNTGDPLAGSWTKSAFSREIVTTMTFSYGGGILPPVPEPASWAMLVLGLGLVGGTLQRRRRTSGTARLAPPAN